MGHDHKDRSGVVFYRRLTPVGWTETQVARDLPIVLKHFRGALSWPYPTAQLAAGPWVPAPLLDCPCPPTGWYATGWLDYEWIEVLDGPDGRPVGFLYREMRCPDGQQEAVQDAASGE